MAASYPGAVKTFTTKAAGGAILAAHINDLQDEVVAVETDLLKAWTPYTPTFDGWAGTVNNVCSYIVIGKTCFVRINITAGTSDGTDGDIATATLPFTSKNVSNRTWDGVCGKCADASTILTNACRWEVLPNTNIVSFYKDMNVGAWTKSGTKYQKAIIIYEIA